MRSRSALKPYRFRFTDEADVARFGDGWYVYDESAIVRMPARQQMRIEAALGEGLKLVQVMEDFANDGIMGRLGATWIGVHLADPAVAGDFDKYEPLVFLINFELVEDPKADVTGPLDPTPTGSSPTTPDTE